MTAREIPPSEWRQFADAFSRSHEGWLVSLSVNQPAGRPQVIIRDVPLSGVAVDARGGASEVVIATNGEEHFVHTVSRPRKIVLHQTEEGADESLTILDCDSMETTLRFRTPANVLEVDGLNL